MSTLFDYANGQVDLVFDVPHYPYLLNPTNPQVTIPPLCCASSGGAPWSPPPFVAPGSGGGGSGAGGGLSGDTLEDLSGGSDGSGDWGESLLCPKIKIKKVIVPPSLIGCRIIRSFGERKCGGATGDTKDPDTYFWNAGADLPAGKYLVSYSGGCVNTCINFGLGCYGWFSSGFGFGPVVEFGPRNNFSVATITPGGPFEHNYPPAGFYPNNFSADPDYQTCIAKSTGRYVIIDHPGGPIGISMWDWAQYTTYTPNLSSVGTTVSVTGSPTVSTMFPLPIAQMQVPTGFGPLTPGIWYFARVLSSTTFALAETYDKASLGIFINVGTNPPGPSPIGRRLGMYADNWGQCSSSYLFACAP